MLNERFDCCLPGQDSICYEPNECPLLTSGCCAKTANFEYADAADFCAGQVVYFNASSAVTATPTDKIAGIVPYNFSNIPGESGCVAVYVDGSVWGAKVLDENKAPIAKDSPIVGCLSQIGISLTWEPWQ